MFSNFYSALPRFRSIANNTLSIWNAKSFLSRTTVRDLAACLTFFWQIQCTFTTFSFSLLFLWRSQAELRISKAFFSAEHGFSNGTTMAASTFLYKFFSVLFHIMTCTIEEIRILLHFSAGGTQLNQNLFSFDSWQNSVPFLWAKVYCF